MTETRTPTAADELAERHYAATLELSPIEATYLGLDLNQDRYDDLSPAGRDAIADLAKRTLAEAEAIAKFHVLQHLSDQAGSATVAAVKTDASGLPAEYPIAFTIGQTPYARFRMKYWGGKVQGVKVVHVEYFDPTRLPDWEQSEEFKEPYPGHFTVAVDLASRRVVDATKKP